MQNSDLVVGRAVVGEYQENCYVIGSRATGEAICIDPGDEPEEILGIATQMGVQIKLITLTHAHFDHVMAVGEVKRKSGARFVLHQNDVPLLQNAQRIAAERFGRQIEGPPTPDGLISDGDTVEVAGVRLTVIHNPGHTQGSVSYYGDGVLFSGDTLFYSTVGRTDLPGGDHQQMMSHIVGRLLKLPDDTIVLPGHMRQTTIADERAANPFIREELEKRQAP